MPISVEGGCWSHKNVLGQFLRDMDRIEQGTIDDLEESFLPDSPDPIVEELDILLDELEEIAKNIDH